MRIHGSSGPAVVSTASAPKRNASGTFSLAEGEAARAAGPASPLRTVGGIDALIALQGIDDATERRRHAVKRGRLALDALDELKIGLLGGELSPATLTKLKAAAVHLRDGSGDAGLDGVLSEIELRVEVEIAKMATP
jgi:hypothetical protein